MKTNSQRAQEIIDDRIGQDLASSDLEGLRDDIASILESADDFVREQMAKNARPDPATFSIRHVATSVRELVASLHSAGVKGDIAVQLNDSDMRALTNLAKLENDWGFSRTQAAVKDGLRGAELQSPASASMCGQRKLETIKKGNGV